LKNKILKNKDLKFGKKNKNLKFVICNLKSSAQAELDKAKNYEY